MLARWYPKNGNHYQIHTLPSGALNIETFHEKGKEKSISTYDCNTPVFVGKNSLLG
jgi:hypothetical protein